MHRIIPNWTFALWAEVSERPLKIGIFGRETWPLAKVPEVAHTHPLSLPQRVKIELIFALWTEVSEIRTIFKIAIFGHETWPLVTVPEGAQYTLFLPHGVKIELIKPRPCFACRGFLLGVCPRVCACGQKYLKKDVTNQLNFWWEPSLWPKEKTIRCWKKSPRGKGGVQNLALMIRDRWKFFEWL